MLQTCASWNEIRLHFFYYFVEIVNRIDDTYKANLHGGLSGSMFSHVIHLHEKSH